MRRALALLACLLLTDCSRRPSPEFRHMLRAYFAAADRAVEAKSRQELIERTQELQAMDRELTSAWPKGWNEDDSFKLGWLEGSLVDAQVKWGPNYEARPEARMKIKEAPRCYTALKSDFEIR